MLSIIATTHLAVLIRHWFEIDLDDSSMEHGCRVELRERGAPRRRGTESAAQVFVADRPLWRADLFDRLGDEPGSFRAAHFHPAFDGVEPCERVWDEDLSADPWGWLQRQFSEVGSATSRLPALGAEDASELRDSADRVVRAAEQFSPTLCDTRSECYRLTRDERESVRLMLDQLQRPDLLDRAAVTPWT